MPHAGGASIRQATLLLALTGSLIFFGDNGPGNSAIQSRANTG
jgi:hypothetical protein